MQLETRAIGCCCPCRYGTAGVGRDGRALVAVFPCLWRRSDGAAGRTGNGPSGGITQGELLTSSVQAQGQWLGLATSGLAGGDSAARGRPRGSHTSRYQGIGSGGCGSQRPQGIGLLGFQLSRLALGLCWCAGPKKYLILFQISMGYPRTRGNTRVGNYQTSGRIRVLPTNKISYPYP
jgi:hypothetical protein